MAWWRFMHGFDRLVTESARAHTFISGKQVQTTCYKTENMVTSAVNGLAVNVLSLPSASR